jgi:hypothetical protein
VAAALASAAWRQRERKTMQWRNARHGENIMASKAKMAKMAKMACENIGGGNGENEEEKRWRQRQHDQSMAKTASYRRKRENNQRRKWRHQPAAASISRKKENKIIKTCGGNESESEKWRRSGVAA